MTEPKRRGRPRKARLEGEAMTINPEVAAEYTAAVKAKAPDPVPGDNGAALERISAFFQAEHPAEWAEIALCPLQHGIPAMVALLKARKS
jgi:hypothetical protein